MHEEYWQLETKPFEPVFERGMFYPHESHTGALLKLRYALENRRDAALLVGPSGVGKTLLVRLLHDELPDEFRPVVHLVFPQMSSRDLLVYLADQLGAPAAESPRFSVEESVIRLQHFLQQNASAGRHAVVIVDEAHLLEDCGALETLRLLLNFNDERPILTVVLLGEPALLSAVSRLPSLEERLAVKSLLRSFTLAETAMYVRHRLQAAGATREIFTPQALEALHYATQGVPRRINRLGDLALLVGFAEGLPAIEAEQIESISQELVAVGAE
ncbi:MAG: AAA family ATPase [Pirellulales bacterium]